jgi:hypothetical protein
MESRTIALVGGGDLVIGGGPPIDGVLHGWIYEEGARAARGGYGFMLGRLEVEQLRKALQTREPVDLLTFAGTLSLTWGEPTICTTVEEIDDELEAARRLAVFSFYPYSDEHPAEQQPERVCRLYDGAIEAAIDALAEAEIELAVERQR